MVQNKNFKKDVEANAEELIDWKKIGKIGREVKTGVVPVVVQDVKTKEVLIVAYTNQEAFEYTMQNGIVAFWSTSRNKLWIKGEEESGNFIKFVEARINCDQNSLVYLVTPSEGVCHIKDEKGIYQKTCFFRQIIYRAGKILKLEIINN